MIFYPDIVFKHVNTSIALARNGFHVKYFEFINQTPYLLLEISHIIWNTMHGITYLFDEYLGATKYLYILDIHIDSLPESLDQGFIVIYNVGTFGFQLNI